MTTQIATLKYTLGTPDKKQTMVVVPESADKVPADDDYFGEGGKDAPDAYVSFGAVRVKGQGNTLNSAIIEHFKEYNITVNEDSEYTFTVKNYSTPKVDLQFPANSAQDKQQGDIDIVDGHAEWTVTGAELKKVMTPPRMRPAHCPSAPRASASSVSSICSTARTPRPLSQSSAR